MAYFWADDFINFLEKENIAKFKLSNFWELLTNGQFLNLVESYENKGKFNVTTSEGLKQLYNIIYKRRIKVRESAFSCSNKDILECLKLYIKYFGTRPKSSNTAPFVIRKNNYSNNLDTDSKNVIFEQIKNTSKFANTLERLKNIAKEKQVLKSDDENIPRHEKNQTVQPVEIVTPLKEENMEEIKENEEKPKSQEITFDDMFYNYLFEKYNSEDEALNLLFGYKLYEIFNKRYNTKNPDKKIDYKADIEFQEFNEDNFGIPKKSLFDYLEFKKILNENKEKENTEQTDRVESKQETGTSETGNIDDNIENSKTEIEEVKTETIENEAEPLETENKSVEIAEEKVEPTEPVETESVKLGEIEYKTIEKKAEIMEVREKVSDKFSLKDVDETFLKNCESLLPTKLYFYGEIIEVKTWKELYISVVKLFAKHFQDLLLSVCRAGKWLLHSGQFDIACIEGFLREPIQICDNLFLTTSEKINRSVKIYLQKIIKMAEICKADLNQIIIFT